MLYRLLAAALVAAMFVAGPSSAQEDEYDSPLEGDYVVVEEPEYEPVPEPELVEPLYPPYDGQSTITFPGEGSSDDGYDSGVTSAQ